MASAPAFQLTGLLPTYTHPFKQPCPSRLKSLSSRTQTRLKRPRSPSSSSICHNHVRAHIYPSSTDTTDTPWPNSPFQLGDLVASRYRITGLLGRGANGLTYEAQPLTASESSSPVALKALSFKAMSNWKSLELFEREAAALRTLSHPAVPRYIDFFDVDVKGDQVFVLVQRKAPGKALQEWLNEGRRFTTEQVAATFRQLLEVLDYLASLNPPVLHRDVKPSNVILDIDGKKPRLSLVDFGGVNAGVRSGTLGSTMVGTFGYMAPEQYGGGGDVRSDLYAAAATVLYMLTGQPPASLPQKRLKMDIESVIPEREQLKLGNIYTVVQKLLEPAPEDRYDSPRAALDALLATRDSRQDGDLGDSGVAGELLAFGSSLAPEDAASLSRAFRAIGTPQDIGGGPLELLTGWAGRRIRKRKPAGTKVTVDRDRANRLLRVTVPPDGISGEVLSKGAFTVAWTGFTAFWTVGVLTGGAPLVFSLFSIPFWAAGVRMAKNTMEQITGLTTLVISFGGGKKEVFYFGLASKGVFGRQDFVEGDARDLDQAMINTEMYVNGEPVTQLVLQEGTRRYIVGRGLQLVEQEWLRDEINDFLQVRRRW